jgi:hypothetical protein
VELSRKVAAILGDAALDTEADPRDSSRVEELENLVPAVGWAALEKEMLALFSDHEDEDHWRVAAEVLWGAALDGRELHVDRVIAHLYFRFPPDDNLAWSITTKLKHLDYLSPYDPMSDLGVIRELEALRLATHR